MFQSALKRLLWATALAAAVVVSSADSAQAGWHHWGRFCGWGYGYYSAYYSPGYYVPSYSVGYYRPCLSRHVYYSPVVYSRYYSCYRPWSRSHYSGCYTSYTSSYCLPCYSGCCSSCYGSCGCSCCRTTVPSCGHGGTVVQKPVVPDSSQPAEPDAAASEAPQPAESEEPAEPAEPDPPASPPPPTPGDALPPPPEEDAMPAPAAADEPAAKKPTADEPAAEMPGFDADEPAPAAPDLDLPELPSSPALPPLPDDAQNEAADGSAVLSVLVPEDAQVYVNGRLTRTPGTFRRYVSHGLESGYQYTYEIQAVVNRDGRRLTDSQVVHVRAGEFKHLTMDVNRAPAAVAIATTLTVHVPDDAQVQLEGHGTQATGAVRQFSTTNLAKGERWDEYRVVATIDRNGRTISQERTLSMVGGQAHELHFDFGADMLTAGLLGAVYPSQDSRSRWMVR